MNGVRHDEYPIIKDPNMSYYVADDGYVYSIPAVKSSPIKAAIAKMKPRDSSGRFLRGTGLQAYKQLVENDTPVSDEWSK